MPTVPEKSLCPSYATGSFLFAEQGQREGAGWELVVPEREGPDPPGSSPHPWAPWAAPALSSGPPSLPESEGMTVTTVVTIPPKEEQTEISLGEVSKACCVTGHLPPAMPS